MPQLHPKPDALVRKSRRKVGMHREPPGGEPLSFGGDDTPSVPLHELRTLAEPMLLHATSKIIRHADVERSMLSACEDVDPVGHDADQAIDKNNQGIGR